MRKTHLETLISMEKPPLEEILLCNEAQTFYRMDVSYVVSFFKQHSTIKQMYNILSTTKSFQLVYKILSLHRSPNKTIIRELSENSSLISAVCKILDTGSVVHRYVLGTVTSILTICFESFPKETFKSFNESSGNYTRLIHSSCLPGIFELIKTIITCNDINLIGKPFLWEIFITLMDIHGPGCHIPSNIVKCKCYKQNNKRLNSKERCNMLLLLSAYFSINKKDEHDIYSAVWRSLPLLLQDSETDYEKSLVFKLALYLGSNQAMENAAKLVVNKFSTSDALLQLSIMYLTEFSVKIDKEAVKILLYRILNRDNCNNFVMLAAIDFISSAIGDGKDESFVEDIEQIFKYFSDKTNNYKFRAFQTAIIAAVEGIKYEEDITVDVMKEVKDILDNTFVIDNLIKQVKAKADVKECSITFNAKELWRKEEIPRMEKAFKTLEKMQNTTPVKRNKKPRKMKLTIITKNLDFNSDGDAGLEDINISPATSPRYLSDDDDNLDKNQLNEIIALSSNYFPPSPGRPYVKQQTESKPLTTVELMKEPIPLMELPNKVKPLHIAARKTPTKNEKVFKEQSPTHEKRAKTKESKVEIDSINELEESSSEEIDSRSIDQVRNMIFKHLSGNEAQKNVKKTKKKQFKIVNVVNDMFIGIEEEKKKPVLNRKVLIVEAFEKPPKLKICLLDSFEIANKQSNKEDDDTKQVSYRRHRHKSVK